MCNCNKTDGYAKAMSNAVNVEKNTGIKQAVFIDKSTKTAYFGAESQVKKRTDICCYTLTNGKEIQIKSVSSKESKQKKQLSKKVLPKDGETKE